MFEEVVGRRITTNNAAATFPSLLTNAVGKHETTDMLKIYLNLTYRHKELTIISIN